MVGNIDTQLFHHGDRFRPEPAGPRPRALHVEPRPRIVAEQAFRHLAASRVAGAQNQHQFLLHVKPLAPRETSAAYDCTPHTPKASPAPPPGRLPRSPAPRRIPRRTTRSPSPQRV